MQKKIIWPYRFTEIKGISLIFILWTVRKNCSEFWCSQGEEAFHIKVWHLWQLWRKATFTTLKHTWNFRSIVCLKVKREVTTLDRINISKSSWNPWLLWQITEEWIGKTHLHCSENPVAGLSQEGKYLLHGTFSATFCHHLLERKRGSQVIK